jgi:hypothetical protein
MDHRLHRSSIGTSRENLAAASSPVVSTAVPSLPSLKLSAQGSRTSYVVEMKVAGATAGAAALLISSAPVAAIGGPPTCADVLKKVERKMMNAGIQQPQLKIVPKNLSTSSQVMASCEGGTQRIVYRPHPAASASLGGKQDAKH